MSVQSDGYIINQCFSNSYRGVGNKVRICEDREEGGREAARVLQLITVLPLPRGLLLALVAKPAWRFAAPYDVFQGFCKSKGFLCRLPC